jgi:hypothetical protein
VRDVALTLFVIFTIVLTFLHARPADPKLARLDRLAAYGICAAAVALLALTYT